MVSSGQGSLVQVLIFSRLLRFALLGLVIGIGVLALILSAGAADPPRVGILRQTLEPVSAFSLPLKGEYLSDQGIFLPASAYTVEIGAVLSSEADPLVSWGLVFFDSDGRELWRLLITGDAYYRLPPFQPDSTSFFHLRPPGQENLIRLDFWPHGESVLRLDQEIAWKGTLPQATKAQIIVIAAPEGRSGGALQVKFAGVYHECPLPACLGSGR